MEHRSTGRPDGGIIQRVDAAFAFLGLAAALILWVTAAVALLALVVGGTAWGFDHALQGAPPPAGPVNHSYCTHCGYDLRASKLRCPECGRPFGHNYESLPPPPKAVRVIARHSSLPPAFIPPATAGQVNSPK